MTLENLELGRQIVETVGWGSVLVVSSDDAQAAGTPVDALRVAGLNTHEMNIGALGESTSGSGSSESSSVTGNKSVAPNDSFDIVACIDCLDLIPDVMLDAVLMKVIGVARRHVFLRVRRACNDSVALGTAKIRDRAWWESKLIAAGLRKHPRYYFAIDYESLEAESDALTIVMERPPAQLLAEYPLSALAAERDLHMDMTREQGRRSDGHMIRYHKAAAFVREGDCVLDAACGLGYGSHILASNTLAGSITGIDGSEYAIRYATTAFSGGEIVSFRVGYFPDALKDYADGSVDFIASFETLEHLEDPEAFLTECHRILSPGGRLMTCVPHDWTEADGRDPNPFHFHVYEWGTFHAQIEKFFILEKGFIQTASRKKVNGRWETSPREWRELSPAQCLDRDSEWCVSLSMKSPLGGVGITVDRPISPHVLGEAPPAYLDFNAQYENPWLVRSMISMGLRMTEPDALTQIARTVESLPTRKADSDAAACVLAYAWLSQTNDRKRPTHLIDTIDRHIDRLRGSKLSPIDVRWKVSLLFAAALIRLATGDRRDAMRLLGECLDQPYLEYSVLLGTKVASAALQLGIMCAADGNVEQARGAWRRGLGVGQSATAIAWEREFGDNENLPDFVLRELTTLFDLVTQCATALRYVRTLPVRPHAIERIVMNKAGQLAGLARSNRALASSLAVQEHLHTVLAMKLEESRANLVHARNETHRLQTYVSQLKAVMGDAAKEILRANSDGRT